MRPPSLGRLRAAALALAAVVGLALASGCGGLLPKSPPPPRFYALDAAQASLPATPAAATAPVLLVNPTSAAAGFDGPHIVYVRVAHQLEHFASSDWVDTPARMLAPLIVSAIEHGGGFRAVGPAASGVAGELRLDTEVLRLEQAFGDGPSRVRFTLRATLSDSATRRAVASQEFDETVTSASEDPYGGVVAANRAVQVVMARLARFCAQGADSWQASRPVRTQLTP